MRLIGLMTAVALGLGLPQVAPIAVGMLPATWTHHLTRACTWEPQAWAARAGTNLLPASARNAPQARACRAQRGLRSETRIIKTLLPRWPTPAELAAMEARYANGRPLFTSATPQVF